MKLFPFYLCLPVILLQAIFASSSLNGKGASHSTRKAEQLKSRTSGSRFKPIAGKLVRKKKPPSTKKKSPRVCKKDKSKDIVIMQNKSKPLIELLPKELVKLVIAYFDDNLYSLIVSAHNYSFKKALAIAVDSVSHAPSNRHVEAKL